MVWKKVGKDEWFNDSLGRGLSIVFVEHVSDGLHFVVTIKEPSYMSVKIIEEKSFDSPIEAKNFAYDYMKKVK